MNTTTDSVLILLVDDHPVFRAALLSLLQTRSGVRVVGQASDGAEAVDLVRRLHPDVVLMDVSMPGMDGIEATRLIRAGHPEVRVIGLSMHEEGEVAEQMRRAGAEAFVSKTAPFEELWNVIRPPHRR